MTVSLFILIYMLGATLASLFTEAIKKAFNNAGKEYSANVIALLCALVIGMGGTSVAYILLGIPWNVTNIVCMILMAFGMWLGSMVGYDKVIQLLEQIKERKA